MLAGKKENLPCKMYIPFRLCGWIVTISNVDGSAVPLLSSNHENEVVLSQLASSDFF
jgi:hypothetical protein